MLERKNIMDARIIAVASRPCGFGCLEIKAVDDEKCCYVWADEVHRKKVYADVERPYFLHDGRRVHLDECIRWDA